MSSSSDTTYLKTLVEKIDPQPRRGGGATNGYYFECDCCGGLNEIITNFENHLVWSCGRKFGCKVVLQIPPKPGCKGTWYAENVQTGLTYEGNILAAGDSHLTGLTGDELAAEAGRRATLKEGAVCNANRARKPKATEMSYRQYQEKEWSNAIGHWKEDRLGMVQMRHNLFTRQDEVAPPLQDAEAQAVNINERQYQTWFAQGIEERVRRDNNAPDIFVDNMAVLEKLLHEQAEQQSTRESPPRRRKQTGAKMLRMSQPLDFCDRGHIKTTEDINSQRSLENHLRKKQELANARGDMLDMLPREQCPFGMFWDGLDEKQGVLRLKFLLKVLRGRGIMFPGFEAVDEFMIIGFKLLKASDGDMEEAAAMAEELHTKTNGKWSQEAWDKYRNAQIAREMMGYGARV
ncbi:hypothetical protein DV736_g3432, partial [Chaetothyriales sp. CBS 134916]